MVHVLDLGNHVLLQVKHAQLGKLLETLDAQEAVVLEPERFQAPVLVERLDLLKALIVKIESVVEVRRVEQAGGITEFLQVALCEDGLAGNGVTIEIRCSEAVLAAT